MIRGFFLILLIIGIIFIAFEIIKINYTCPNPKTIIKYNDKNLNDIMDEQPYVSDIFLDLFTKPTPWINATNDLDTRKRENINQFFISQI